NRESSELARPERAGFLPSAAHDVPPLPTCEEKSPCASHPVRDRRERDKLARSRLQRASCALLLRLSPVDLVQIRFSSSALGLDRGRNRWQRFRFKLLHRDDQGDRTDDQCRSEQGTQSYRFM